MYFHDPVGENSETEQHGNEMEYPREPVNCRPFTNPTLSPAPNLLNKYEKQLEKIHLCSGYSTKG